MEQLFEKAMISSGGALFLCTYESTNFNDKENIALSLSLTSLYSSILEEMDENVEFIVATPLKTFFFPLLLLSKAISIVFSSF